MASTAAILRAAQAAPGAAQPTYPPQGGSPWIGQLPSYGSEPGSGYSYAYNSFLPRPQQTFTEGAFGPFSPILPVPVDRPGPGLPRAQPRRWQYQVGWNLPVGQPGTEGYKLASFQTLRTLADTYSILRTCLERRKNEIRALEWEITLTPDAANAYQGDRQAMRDFGERKAKAVKFFKRPDPNYFTFSSWLHAMMDQVFTLDALSLYMCPKKGRGLGKGLFGSDLDSLWLLDGSTIRPLLDLHGGTPSPPGPAYQQFIYGVPRADLATMAQGLDLQEYGLTGDDLVTELRGDQLIYYPYLERPDSPYGMSLVEQCIIPIMTGLRRQAMQLDYFNESSVPRVWLSPGDNTLTPNQLRELQDSINAIAGDIAWAFKVMVVPPGSKVIPQKDFEIVSDADNWIATEVAMACDVSPVEIGLLPKVSAAASPFAAREMAQASRSIHERTATKPTLSYITDIFDYILQVVCGQDDMRFVFDGMEQTQDLAALTDMGIKQVQSGVKTIDEFRDDLHLTRFNLPETKSPVVFTQLGPVPLGQAAGQAQAQVREASTQAVGDGHRAGSSGPKALPAGSSGQGRMNGPVTQRQARRGGALAPAHATAEGAPGHSGGKPAPKAAAAELEALGRHLRKGMNVAEWVPEHIPGTVMAIISEDLGKGLSAGYVLAQAAVSLGKAPAQSPQQSQAQQRRQMAALSARFQPQIAAAFGSALAQAQGLIAAWVAGTLAVTAALLALMIAELIRKALLAVLVLLWTAAFEAGAKAAGGSPSQADLQAFLDTEGRTWADLISGTGAAALVAAIRAAIAAGDPQAVADRLAQILDTANRSGIIAVSEVTRAWNAGILAALKGTGYVRWQTKDDDRVCVRCMANQNASPLPAGSLFPEKLASPPQHPSCRCVLLPSEPPKAQKVLRREVGLNGQETWTEWTPDPETTGGRVFRPHIADGTEVPQGGVPGASAGGEPPRWDGSEPRPVVERAPDADDSAAYGSASGIGSRPGAYWPSPYMDGWWPSPAGHGTGQPGSSSPGGQNGRPPNAAGKAARDAAARFLKGKPAASPAAVRSAMRKNFPSSALRWVGKIRWAGPVDLPLELIEDSGRDKWAARHQQDHVDRIAADAKAGKPVSPAILVLREGHNHARLIDGRHRFEAMAKLGRPLRAYVGYLDAANEKAAYDTYLHQIHSGSSPQNKSFTAGSTGDGSASGLVPLAVEGQRQGAYVAGLAVRAADTGRVLMIQRAMDEQKCPCGMTLAWGMDGGDWWSHADGSIGHEDGTSVADAVGAEPPDPAAGLFEFPGGHAEDGETLLQAAMREFGEEVGQKVPDGTLTGRWESPNGIYAGFVLTVPRETDVPLGEARRIANPDGDAHEPPVWWATPLMDGNPAIRPEILADLPLILAAFRSASAKSAQTPVVSTEHHPLGHQGLWHTPDKHVPSMQQLPAYHQNTARALMRSQGMGESQAIATAINAIREWRHGTAFGGRVKVTPEVQAAAARADDEWNKLKESHHP